MEKRIIFIILTVIWLIVIFTFSSQEGEISDKNSMKIATQLSRAAKNFRLDGNIKTFNFVTRKIGHFGEYFILTLLVFGILSTTNINDKYKYIFAWIIPVIYAIIDEYNQRFIVGRSGTIKDVVIDSIGAVAAIIFIFSFTYIRAARDDT